MSTVQGVVASKSRAGTGIRIGEQWYNGTKGVLADIEWKDTVEAEIDSDGKKIISIKKTASAAPAPQAQASVNWDERQQSILWQSSRKDAVNTVRLMVEQGVVKLPTKQEAKYDAVLDLIHQVNKKLYFDSLPAHIPSEE